MKGGIAVDVYARGLEAIAHAHPNGNGNGNGHRNGADAQIDTGTLLEAASQGNGNGNGNGHGNGANGHARDIEEYRLRCDDGSLLPLRLERWLGHPTPEEHALLDRVGGPVLDVGCGPGRHVLALGARGIPALGIDIAPGAVRLARRRGVSVLRRSVFDQLPGQGWWGAALLLDGNIGIGGDPVALLRRIASVLRADGRVFVELDEPDAASGAINVRIEGPHEVSHWFPWARLASHDVEDVAFEAGLRACDCWQAGGRWFACLAPAG